MDTVTAMLPDHALWRHFAAIAAIPRCSREEARVRSYVIETAEALGLTYATDSAGNVVVRKPAGRDYAPVADGEATPVVLQGHLDMVCEKNFDTPHDFTTEGIRLVRDGDWLRADGTTLGADNGIAVAMMLALLESDDATLPALECLFTVDEETGLTGAVGLDPSLITGRRLINLDSEEEGYFCIGCAGGTNTYGSVPLVWEERATDASAGARSVTLQITVGGLRGGHSGVDIHEERGNAVVLGGRVLAALLDLDPPVRLATIRGGDKHNAIPRECRLVVTGGAAQRAVIEQTCATLAGTFRGEFGASEPELSVSIQETEAAARVMGASSARTVARTLLALPHGVLGMSRAIPGLVETSSNLAAVEIRDGALSILTSQRSSQASLVTLAARTVGAVVELAGGSVRNAEGYPAWPPRSDSALRETAIEVFRAQYARDPEIGVIHAGLECGVIGDKAGGMDMISLGPDMDGVHTPNERLNIPSTERTWSLLTGILHAL